MYKMIYDGVDVSKYIVVENIKRQLINIKVNYGEIPGKHGLIFRNKKHDKKDISISIRLIEDIFHKNLNETRDLLNKILVKDSPKKLELSDYPDRYEYAVLDGNIDFEKFLKTGFINLKFNNPSGIFYSKKTNNNTTNDGNVDTPIIIKGKIDKSLVTILHKESLKKITIDTSKYIGKTIEVDTEKEIILINNNLNMKSLFFDSDFFFLNPGENTIEIDGLSAINYNNQARWM